MKTIIALLMLTGAAWGQDAAQEVAVDIATCHTERPITSTSPVHCKLASPSVPNWHLFTQSRGGTVSLLHGMTKEVCETARNMAAPSVTCIGACNMNPGDIIRAECFQ